MRRLGSLQTKEKTMSKKFLLALLIGLVIEGSGAQSYSICLYAEDAPSCLDGCLGGHHCAPGKFKSAVISEKHCPPIVKKGNTCLCSCDE